MQRVPSFLIAAVAAAGFAVLTASPVRADTSDQLTYFTFSAPFEVPGVSLPAGTYMFKLAGTDGRQDVVRVLSGDGSRVYATFFAIPEERSRPTSEPTVRFEERAGSPEAIKVWFYPGDTIGHEFVYPTDQARRIAAAGRGD